MSAVPGAVFSMTEIILFAKGVDRAIVSIYRNIMKKEFAMIVIKESSLWWWRSGNDASGGLP
jgi:hypothetical protein